MKTETVFEPFLQPCFRAVDILKWRETGKISGTLQPSKDYWTILHEVTNLWRQLWEPPMETSHKVRTSRWTRS
jgi:hypothetical protein